MRAQAESAACDAGSSICDSPPRAGRSRSIWNFHDNEDVVLAPSPRTTNLLWGNAASMCSICKVVLSVGPTPVDRHAVIGDVAHIVASSPAGARGNDPRPQDTDEYDNLILLCKNDHKKIDDQPNAYPVDWLKNKREAHESWVRSRTGPNNAVPGVNSRFRRLRYGPSEWMSRQVSNGPELLVRCVVALPGATVDLTGQKGQVASLLGSDEREAAIENVLKESELTAEILTTAQPWGWKPGAGWQVQGGSPGPEITDLQFHMTWPTWRIRQPLDLRATVLTGYTPDVAGELTEAIVVALDLGLSLLELDADRRPADMAHRSAPPPAPAALKLNELAKFVELLISEVGPLAVKLAGPLVGLPSELRGHLTAWMQHNTVELERLIDLSQVTRLPNPTNSMRAEATDEWPLVTADDSERSPEALTRRLIATSLENNDYRGFTTVLEDLFSPTH